MIGFSQQEIVTMKLHWQIALIGMMFSILIVHPVAAQAPLCSGPGINLLAHRLDAQTVTVQFSVCDRNGVSIDTLAPGSIRLAEDGMVVANARIDSFVADRAQPVVAVDLVNGARQELSAIGASIGIVFDATELLNGTGANMRDHIGSGRVAIEEFLLEPGNPPPPRTMAPNNPERVGLFIPVDSPAQSLRPDQLPDFTIDRYAVVNTLRAGLPVRKGKTNLLAAVQAAIDATARNARQYCAQALVLVVSDGGDAISGDALNGLIAQANQNNVRIIAFGVGTDQSLERNGFRLQQIAEATGGRYFQRPTSEQAAAAFDQFVTAQPSALYSVSYQTQIIDDGKSHQLTIEVVTRDGAFSSALPLVLTPQAADELLPVIDVLARQYLLFAIPTLVLVSIAVAVVLTLIQTPSPLANRTKR